MNRDFQRCASYACSNGNTFRPKSPLEVIKSLAAPFAILTDTEQLSSQTAPAPPTLALDERRRSSVKVTWHDFPESEETTFLVRLTPSNGQFYSTADTDVLNTWVALENLDPDTEYELQVWGTIPSTEISTLKANLSINLSKGPSRCVKTFSNMSV